MEPLEKEEPLPESPIFSPVPESITSVAGSSDAYYTAQEDIDEEITEAAIVQKTIDRPKLVSIEPEELIFESPERDLFVEEMLVDEEERVTPTPQEEVQKKKLL